MYNNQSISKRADALHWFKEQLLNQWRSNEGPFENILRNFAFFIPMVPGLGWGAFIFEKIASQFGYGLNDVGARLDKILRYEPGEGIGVPSIDDLSGALHVLLGTVTGSTEEEVKKVAFFGGLVKFVPKLAKWLFKAVKVLLLVFGITRLGDMYSETFQTKKMPGEIMLDKVTPTSGPGTGTSQKKDKDEGYSYEDAMGLMNLMTPSGLSKVVNPFNPANLLG